MPDDGVPPGNDQPSRLQSILFTLLVASPLVIGVVALVRASPIGIWLILGLLGYAALVYFMRRQCGPR